MCTTRRTTEQVHPFLIDEHSVSQRDAALVVKLFAPPIDQLDTRWPRRIATKPRLLVPVCRIRTLSGRQPSSGRKSVRWGVRTTL